MDNVKVLKLTTGEEIVSEIVDEGSYYKLKNPVKFVMMPIDDTRVGVEMHPFVMLAADEEFEIPKDVVLLVANPMDNVLQSYKQNFSELVLPSEKQIVT